MSLLKRVPGLRGSSIAADVISAPVIRTESPRPASPDTIHASSSTPDIGRMVADHTPRAAGLEKHLPPIRTRATPRERRTTISASSTAAAYDQLAAGASESPTGSLTRAHAGSLSAATDMIRLLRQATSPRHATVRPIEELLSQRCPHQLFDYFCVCGVRDATTPEAAPEALFCVPETAHANDAAGFCFPSGHPLFAEVTAAPRHESGDQVRTGENTFMFCMQQATPVTGELITHYAFVVRHTEIMEEPPRWLPEQAIRRGPILGARHTTQRAYCIVSRNPYAKLFWSLLWELARIEHTRITATDKHHVERAERNGRRFIEMLATLVQVKIQCGEQFVLRSKACFANEFILFNVPSVEQGPRISVACMCVPALMRALTPHTLVSVLGAALAESSILFVAAHAGRASACATAVVALLAPLQWKCVFVPLMPDALIDVIGSPVAVVCGRVGASSAVDTDLLASGRRLVVVHVDANQITVHGDALPEMPCQPLLIRELVASCAWLRGTRRVMGAMCEDLYPFEALDERAAQQTMCAIEEIGQYVLWLVNSVRRLLPEHRFALADHIGNSIYTTSLVMRTHEQHRAFMAEFMESQQFAALAPLFAHMPEPNRDEEGTYGDYEL